MKKTMFKVGGFSLAAFLGGLIFVSIIGLPPKTASAIPVPPQLVLYMAGSAGNPFSDLSPYHHQVNLIQAANGGNVQVDFDFELERNVFSFANGGWLEIPDIYGLFKTMGSEEMTIEVCAKAIDPSVVTYSCGEQPLPITSPVPDQMILQKGDFFGNSNYYVHFGWGRDDMRKEYCDPFGYFPGFGWNFGGSTDGIYSPPNPNLTAGWKVFSFRITQEDKDPPVWWMPGAKVVWSYTNRNDNPYPATYLPAQVDLNAALAAGAPLIIGNGRPTNGTNPFNPNPFFGRISYIRIYKGLLDKEQLNNDPKNALPDLPVPNRPPVALAKDITIETGADCEASITAAMLNNGSYDPDGDVIGLSVDSLGPFSAGPSGQKIYLVTLTVTDPGGLSASCPANVTVIDVLPPVISASDPVCVTVGNGNKKSNKITLIARDNCSNNPSLQITKVEVFNNGGNLVNGNGIYEISGNIVYVNPNGNGWTVKITATAVDGNGNMTPEPVTVKKSLLKC